METSATQPLSGVRVIDFTQVMLGPSATQVLADYGADVIKIERPGAGDLSRSSIPDDPDGLDNPVFRSLNRNKRSIALDLRKEDGKAIIYDLVRGADVVVNNFRAGVMERMGFGHDELARINPRIICAFGSGFGRSGPLAYKGGQDILAQALSGVMRRKCNDDEPLAVYATSLCDYTAGMHLVQAILLALLQREKTGRGQQVELTLTPVSQQGDPGELHFFPYSEGKIDRLYLIHAQFVNTMTQKPHVQQLLPVVASPTDGLQEHWDYLYEPEAAEILDGLLKRYVESQVYQGAVENVACEMAARMVAMKSASDNAGKLIGELQLIYNKARQAAITKELAEIVGGAAAV